MKTQEELQHESFNQISNVENALIKLDRASMILGHWTDEYVFTEKPNPREAVKWLTSMGSEGITGKSGQSVKWFYEYNQIIGFVDIAFDYVFECKKLLEKAVYGKKANEGVV